MPPPQQPQPQLIQSGSLQAPSGGGFAPLPTSLPRVPRGGSGSGPGGPSQGEQNFFDLLVSNPNTMFAALATIIDPGLGIAVNSILAADDVKSQQQAAADATAAFGEEALAQLNSLPGIFNDFVTGQQPQLQEAQALQARGSQLGARLGSLVGQQQEQEKKDINRQFNELTPQLRSNLAERGLSGSTLFPTLQTGIERERADALGRFNDRQIQQDINLTGAQANLDLAFTSPLINTFGAQNTERFQAQRGIVGDLTNFFTSQQFNAPSTQSVAGPLGPVGQQSPNTFAGGIFDR